MLYILILLLIPVFFVGIVIYTCTIFDFMLHNKLDMVLLLIGVFSTIISSFFALKEFSLLDIKNKNIIKLQKKVDALIGIFSFTLLFLFGVALIVNSILFKMDFSKLLLGIMFVSFYVYVIYYYVIQKKVYVCTISDITKVSDDLYLVLFNNKEIGVNEYYVKDKKGLKKDKSYKVYYSNANKCITRILNEVIEV